MSSPFPSTKLKDLVLELNRREEEQNALDERVRLLLESCKLDDNVNETPFDYDNYLREREKDPMWIEAKKAKHNLIREYETMYGHAFPSRFLSNEFTSDEPSNRATTIGTDTEHTITETSEATNSVIIETNSPSNGTFSPHDHRPKQPSQILAESTKDSPSVLKHDDDVIDSDAFNPHATGIESSGSSKSTSTPTPTGVRRVGARTLVGFEGLAEDDVIEKPIGLGPALIPPIPEPLSVERQQQDDDDVYHPLDADQDLSSSFDSSEDDILVVVPAANNRNDPNSSNTQNKDRYEVESSFESDADGVSNENCDGDDDVQDAEYEDDESFTLTAQKSPTLKGSTSSLLVGAENEDDDDKGDDDNEETHASNFRKQFVAAMKAFKDNEPSFKDLENKSIRQHYLEMCREFCFETDSSINFILVRFGDEHVDDDNDDDSSQHFDVEGLSESRVIKLLRLSQVLGEGATETLDSNYEKDCLHIQFKHCLPDEEESCISMYFKKISLQSEQECYVLYATHHPMNVLYRHFSTIFKMGSENETYETATGQDEIPVDDATVEEYVMKLDADVLANFKRSVYKVLTEFRQIHDRNPEAGRSYYVGLQLNWIFLKHNSFRIVLFRFGTLFESFPLLRNKRDATMKLFERAQILTALATGKLKRGIGQKNDDGSEFWIASTNRPHFRVQRDHMNPGKYMLTMSHKNAVELFKGHKHFQYIELPLPPNVVQGDGQGDSRGVNQGDGQGGDGQGGTQDVHYGSAENVD